MQRVEFGGAGVPLVGDVAGPEGGVPMLFLHGAGQTRQSWGAAVAKAADRGYRAVSLDLRGHGESGWSADGDYHIDRFADDIGRVVDWLGGPTILVGASLGGLTSLLVTASGRHVVAALVLVDVAARLERDGTGEIARFMASGVDGFVSVEAAADAVAAYLPHRPRPSDVSGLTRNLRLRADGRYHWHWDPAFNRIRDRAPRPDPSVFEEAARRVDVPTLLVRGGRSRVVTEDSARAMLALLRRGELVAVAGADHMVAGDANDQFSEAVLAFLERHVPAGTSDAPAPDGQTKTGGRFSRSA